MKRSLFSLSLYSYLMIWMCVFSSTQAQTKSNIKERKMLFKEIVEGLQEDSIENGERQLYAVIRGGLLRPQLIENNKFIQQKLTLKVRADLIQKAQIHRDRFLKQKNSTMAALMDTLLERDQKYRMAAYACVGEDLSIKAKRDSCLQIYKAQMDWADSLNLAILDSLVAEYGWVNESWVGDAEAAWAIVWHNGLETLQRYFPLMKAAYLEGEFKASHFHGMEDKLLLKNCQPQLHNTISCKDKQTGEYIPCTPNRFNPSNCQ